MSWLFTSPGHDRFAGPLVLPQTDCDNERFRNGDGSRSIQFRKLKAGPLTKILLFGTYGIMEIAREQASGKTMLARRNSQSQRDLDAVLTDAALSELKKQAPAGCVLCVLDQWDGEWD